MLPVLVHFLSRLIPLWLGLALPGAGLLDLDPVELGGERLVDVELVVGLDLFTLGRLDQDPLARLTNRQGLECSGELPAVTC